jgi:hypothetical protein
LIISMIIQTILLDLSGAVWTDGASNVSRLDPSGAIQVDAEHPSRKRKADRVRRAVLWHSTSLDGSSVGRLRFGI